MNLKELIGALAPTAARMLGGPLAEMAVQKIGEAIGIDQPTQQKISDVISQGKLTGEQFVAMRQADQALHEKLAELNVRLEEIESSDRKSARDMLVATRAKTPAALSWVIVLSTFALEGYVMVNGIPPAVQDLVAGRILGTFDAALVTVISFWLGAAHQAQGRSADQRKSA